MRKMILEFIRRGFVACGFGPIVLVVCYLILQQKGMVQFLTVNEVCTGILSLAALAFIAGGMNVIYQMERLPLMLAILIHGVVLYISYLVTYLINGWLEWGKTPIFVFSAIFVVTYLVIWIVIYTVNKKRSEQMNELLRKKQENRK